MPSLANDRQVGGQHYAGTVQHWDYAYQHFGAGYFQGQITKYVCRWRKKNGLQDLKKAAHFLEKLQELQAVRTVPTGMRGFLLRLASAMYERMDDKPAISVNDMEDLLPIERAICRLVQAGDLLSLSRAATSLAGMVRACALNDSSQPTRRYVDPDGQDAWEMRT